jgi:hypothetical protein
MVTQFVTGCLALFSWFRVAFYRISVRPGETCKNAVLIHSIFTEMRVPDLGQLSVRSSVKQQICRFHRHNKTKRQSAVRFEVPNLQIQSTCGTSPDARQTTDRLRFIDEAVLRRIAQSWAAG